VKRCRIGIRRLNQCANDPRVHLERLSVPAPFGIVPRRHIPAGVKVFDTMNARSESVEQKRSVSRAWKNLQLALIPRIGFFEPDYETGNAVRCKIGAASGDPLAIAGQWRQWKEADGSLSLAFTMLTVNSDEHPLRKAQRYRDKFGKPVAWRQRNPIPMRYDRGRRNESSRLTTGDSE